MFPAMFAEDISAAASRFETIREEVPWTFNLHRYDPWETIKILSGLLTCPLYHANTIRIEALIQLTAAMGKGTEIPNRDDLTIWLNFHFRNTSLSFLEDPIEDVFISNVIDQNGNYRIFEGIWERNDYWLQCLIRACRQLPNLKEYTRMFESIQALLYLSDLLAERNGLMRNIPGGGEAKGRLNLPTQPEIDLLAERVIFKSEELNMPRIKLEALSPFIWGEEENEKILAFGVGNSPMEDKPLLFHDGKLLIALPTAISMAIRHFIVKEVKSKGELRHLQYLLNKLQFAEIKQHGISRMKTSLSFPITTSTKNSSPFKFEIAYFQFDQDKFGALFLIQPPLTNENKTSISNFDDCKKYYFEIQKLILRTIAVVSKHPHFKWGMFILLAGGMGESFAIEIPKFPENWEFVQYSVPDFITLASVPDVDMRMIWRLTRQQIRAQKRGVKIVNPNGDFNLFSIWKNSNFSLVPEDAITGKGDVILTTPTNAMLSIRNEARNQVDVHSVYCKSFDTWIEVERVSVFSPFGEEQFLPFYGNPYMIHKGLLVGVVEFQRSAFWIIAQLQSEDNHSVVFQFWDCFGHWLTKIVPKIGEILNLSDVSVEIKLILGDSSKWKNKQKINLSQETEKLNWDIDPQGKIQFYITEAFFDTISQPINHAEREMVFALIQATLYLTKKKIELSEALHLRDSIIPMGNARHLHVTILNDATLADKDNDSERNLNREEVIKEIEDELGWNVAKEFIGKRIEIPEEIRRLTEISVDFLRKKIEEDLHQYNRLCVIEKCLKIFNSIHRKEHNLGISIAANNALNNDKNETFSEIRKMASHYAGSDISCRVLIEIALYSCPDSGKTISETDLDEFLAMALVLVVIADYGQPSRKKFPAGRIIIGKNGNFRIENDFIQRVRDSYVRTSYDDELESAIDSYSTYFPVAKVKEENVPIAMFSEALYAEFGLTLKEMIFVGEFLNQFGTKIKKSIIKMRKSEFITLLATQLKKDEKQLLIFFDSFRIFVRSARDEDLPSYCKPIDITPWQHKRRFSLLRRPIIEITQEEDPLLILSPAFIRKSFQYIFKTTLHGDFPHDFFTTSEMKKFNDYVVEKRGKLLVEEVASIMKDSGFEFSVEKKMNEFNAPKILGDIDILAWRVVPMPLFIVIECKALKHVLSFSEILSQMDHFRGEITNPNDFLFKHIRRVQWLSENQQALLKTLKLDFLQLPLQLKNALVTNRRVPMEFLDDEERHSVPFVNLENIKSFLANLISK